MLAQIWSALSAGQKAISLAWIIAMMTPVLISIIISLTRRDEFFDWEIILGVYLMYVLVLCFIFFPIVVLTF